VGSKEYEQKKNTEKRQKNKNRTKSQKTNKIKPVNTPPKLRTQGPSKKYEITKTIGSNTGSHSKADKTQKAHQKPQKNTGATKLAAALKEGLRGEQGGGGGQKTQSASRA